MELAHRNREGDRDKLKERIAELKTEVEDVTEDLYECRREKEMKNKLLVIITHHIYLTIAIYPVLFYTWSAL